MAKPKKRLRAKITVGKDLNGNPILKWASGYTNWKCEKLSATIDL